MPSSHEPPKGGKEPIRPRFVKLLQLVHPAPPPKPKKRRRRHEGSVFTPEEQARLRLALKNVRRVWTRPKLAKAMGCAVNTLQYAENGCRYGFSAALAIRLARVTGISLDAILAPGLRIVDPRPGPAGAA